MKVAIHALSLIGLIGFTSAGCLLKPQILSANKCVIDENPITDESWLLELCKNLTSIGDLSIVAEYKNKLQSYRTLADYCNDGPVGRFSWVKSSEIDEALLNSKDVDAVSTE